MSAITTGRPHRSLRPPHRRPMFRIAPAVLAAAALIGSFLLPAPAHAVEKQIEIGDLKYSIDLENVDAGAEVIGPASSDELPPRVLEIPDTIEYEGHVFTIVYIWNGAFEDSGVTDVDFPEGLHTIGRAAFKDADLQVIELPDSVTTIRASAFEGNSLNGTLELPDNLRRLGSTAFADNSLTELTIPNTVTQIHHSTFAENRLESVDLPEELTLLGDKAFRDNSLEELVFPASVTSIGDRILLDDPEYWATKPIFTGPAPDLIGVDEKPFDLAHPVDFLWSERADETPGGFTWPTWTKYDTVPRAVVEGEVNGADSVQDGLVSMHNTEGSGPEAYPWGTLEFYDSDDWLENDAPIVECNGKDVSQEMVWFLDEDMTEEISTSDTPITEDLTIYGECPDGVEDE